MQFTKRTPKVCKNCGKDFLAKKSGALYCSQACRPSANDGRQLTLAPTKCGAHSELIASAYLLRQGYDVYRAVNWTSKADLVAVRGDEILRVQVRTGAQLGNGTFVYTKPVGGHHDLLIVVNHAGEIIVEEYSDSWRGMSHAA
jgi:hypothetical protein